MENLPIKTFDVLSFTGLIALVPFMLEGFKRLMGAFISGREPWVCMILCFVIGIPVKYYTPTAYNGLTGPMGWIVTVIGLFLCGVGAMAVHDNVLSKMFGWKTDPLTKPPSTSGDRGGAQ